MQHGRFLNKYELQQRYLERFPRKQDNTEICAFIVTPPPSLAGTLVGPVLRTAVAPCERPASTLRPPGPKGCEGEGQEPPPHGEAAHPRAPFCLALSCYC